MRCFSLGVTSAWSCSRVGLRLWVVGVLCILTIPLTTDSNALGARESERNPRMGKQQRKRNTEALKRLPPITAADCERAAQALVRQGICTPGILTWGVNHHRREVK